MYGLRGGERQRDLFVCSRFYGTWATGAVMCQKGKGSPAYCATGTILEPGHLLLRHFWHPFQASWLIFLGEAEASMVQCECIK